MLLPVLQIDTWITDVSAGLTALQMDDAGTQRFAWKRSALLEEEDRRSSDKRQGRAARRLKGK